MPQSQEYKSFFDERDKLILDYIAEHPGCTRKEIVLATAIPYSTIRYRTKKYILRGWIDAKIEKRRWYYWIKRGRRIVVTSFQFTVRRAKEVNYPIDRVKKERHIEIIVDVDKPDIIDIEPEYVLAVFLDYSAWGFSIGTPRGRKYAPYKIEWPAREFWLPEFIKKEQRRIRLAMKKTLPEAGINVGSTDVEKSRFKGGEYFVRIVYTDYDYPNNSFNESRLFKDALHKFKESVFKNELVGWIIGIDNKHFKWGTPAWFEEKRKGGKIAP